MSRSIPGAVALALSLLVTGCSGAPSDDALREAADRLMEAPTPEGFVPVEAPAADPSGALPYDDRGVFRQELCSDGSCPILVRWYSSVAFETTDDACDILSDWVVALGGDVPDPCPPPSVLTVTGDSTVSDQTVVVVDDGSFGDTVLAEFVQSGDGPVVMTLALGRQFCSDASIAQACVDG